MSRSNVVLVSWRLLALSFTLVPALFAWWSGRQIVRLIGDPALAERLLLRQRQQQLVLFAGFVAPQLVAGVLTAAVVSIVLALSIADRTGVVALVEARPGAGPGDSVLLARFELPTGSERRCPAKMDMQFDGRRRS